MFRERVVIFIVKVQDRSRKQGVCMQWLMDIEFLFMEMSVSADISVSEKTTREGTEGMEQKRDCLKKNIQKTKKRNLRSQGAAFLFLLPSLVGSSVFLIVPFGDVIRRSFTEAVSGAFVGLANYRSIFANKAFLLAMQNTLRFLGVCIPLLVSISLALAVILKKQTRYGKFCKSCFLLPMALPVASVVLLWKALFSGQGLLNGWLSYLGISGVDYMNTDAAFWVLVVSYLWRNVGYDMVLWMAGLSAIPDTLYEAAQVDGAGEWRCFLSITLPNLLPSLSTITILSLLNAFKVFREAYLAAGDYPHESMYLIQHLFNNWYRDLSLDKMAAAAVVNCAGILLLVILLLASWGKEETE